jgi:hypothetical protein
MYQKRCEGCGTTFEALKPSRKWCSDLCGKRTRRRNSAAVGRRVGPALPGRSPVISSDNPDVDSDDSTETLRENLAFARGVVPDLVLDLDCVEALVDVNDPGWANGCTSEDWVCVARALVRRLIAQLEEFDSLAADDDDDRLDAVIADVESGLTRLSEFLGDSFSNRVIAQLAAALRDADGGPGGGESS